MGGSVGQKQAPAPREDQAAVAGEQDLPDFGSNSDSAMDLDSMVFSEEEASVLEEAARHEESAAAQELEFTDEEAARLQEEARQESVDETDGTDGFSWEDDDGSLWGEGEPAQPHSPFRFAGKSAHTQPAAEAMTRAEDSTAQMVADDLGRGAGFVQQFGYGHIPGFGDVTSGIMKGGAHLLGDAVGLDGEQIAEATGDGQQVAKIGRGLGEFLLPAEAREMIDEGGELLAGPAAVVDTIELASGYDISEAGTSKFEMDAKGRGEKGVSAVKNGLRATELGRLAEGIELVEKAAKIASGEATWGDYGEIPIHLLKTLGL